MLSKSQISFVKSLHTKKNRKESGLFIVEGVKSVTEFIHSGYLIDTIFYTEKSELKLNILSQNVKLFEIKEDELRKISTLMAPQHALALVKIPPDEVSATFELPRDVFTLMLDNIQDPGNLGTIIRMADWLGFTQLSIIRICISCSKKALYLFMGLFSTGNRFIALLFLKLGCWFWVTKGMVLVIKYDN